MLDYVLADNQISKCLPAKCHIVLRGWLPLQQDCLAQVWLSDVRSLLRPYSLVGLVIEPRQCEKDHMIACPAFLVEDKLTAAVLQRSFVGGRQRCVFACLKRHKTHAHDVVDRQKAGKEQSEAPWMEYSHSRRDFTSAKIL